MSNVSEENAQVQADSGEIHPDGARYGFASYISRRPSWATETRIDPETIVHYWTSPTLADGADTSDGEAFPIPVEITQEDDLFVMEDGVTLDPGQPVIFLLDTTIRDTANGRKLAAAIIECCDRIDASKLDTSPVADVR